jgi:hypothetical protein
VRTYKEIGEFVMSKIAELGEQDRALQQPAARKGAIPASPSTISTNS